MGPVAAGNGQSLTGQANGQPVSGQAGQRSEPVMSRSKQGDCVFVGWMDSSSDLLAATPAHLPGSHLPGVSIQLLVSRRLTDRLAQICGRILDHRESTRCLPSDMERPPV